jgi:hypothetical protein
MLVIDVLHVADRRVLRRSCNDQTGIRDPVFPIWKSVRGMQVHSSAISADGRRTWT